ncbi:unnamed protein product [Adineta ricciae]|uniref:TIR domain-containing protein n=1 Tax=Adineta ricciae TaxID=249248 RepID=A0A815IXV3_ADIRI|nr:unnamed protein product [Adineta ricciae]CAF1369473.1 unnamed protein product [Adineta ricciae]
MDETEETKCDVFKAEKESVNKSSPDGKESTDTSKKSLQSIRDQLQKLHDSDASAQDRYQESNELYSELIDYIARATDADANDIQICANLFEKVMLQVPSKAFSQERILFTRKVFFKSLNLLSKQERYMYFHDYQQTTTAQTEFYKPVVRALLRIAYIIVGNMHFVKEDTASRKYTKLFCAMCKSVERSVSDATANCTEEDDDLDSLTSCILSFIWNLSDSTIVVPWLLDTELPKMVLKWLKAVTLSSAAAEQFVSIIHNISRHNDGADELKKFDGLCILQNIQNDNKEELPDKNNLLISMAIAHLSTVEQIRLDNKRKNTILNQLLQMTIDAAQEDDYRDGDGFHVSEPLIVFVKLFVDDRSLEYVLNHAETDPQLTLSATIALFVDLLIKFQDSSSLNDYRRQLVITALLNILWSISFQDRYKTKLKQNDKLIEIIKTISLENDEKMADQYVSRSMESPKNASNGILHNLNVTSHKEENVIASLPIASNAGNSKAMIMISYAHDNDRFCDEILKALEKDEHLFRIWIDRDHCSSSEDLWEKIARGIGEANLVVCLLSQDYYNSKSCRKEITFAIKRNKPIVPIYFGEPGDCDWLDIHIADRKYVRFKSNTNELDATKTREMLKTIESTISETKGGLLKQQRIKQHNTAAQSQKENDKIQSTDFDKEKSPEEWNREDIQKWFHTHNVPDTLVKLYDFQSMAEINQYALKLQADPKNEFLKYARRYANAYGGDELEEYIFDRFKNSLLKLPVNRRETLSLPMSSSTTLKSTACILL